MFVLVSLVSLGPKQGSLYVAPVNLSILALHYLIVRMQIVDKGLIDNDL
jgi:hypothetical protein